jgi:nucleotide-binding universal stress UspA family protein
MTRIRRRSYETGHRPKYLVVADASPEADRALYFAARRAARTGAAVVALAVVSVDDVPPLLGVGDVMRAEAEDKAQARLDKVVARARAVASIEPETVIREGHTAEQVAALIQEDEDIAILVLAAGTGSDGPGPLVSSLAKGASAFSIPVTIVPGDLADAEIDALAG